MSPKTLFRRSSGDDLKDSSATHRSSISNGNKTTAERGGEGEKDTDRLDRADVVEIFVGVCGMMCGARPCWLVFKREGCV